MKLRNGRSLFVYAVLALAFSALVSLHCGPGNSGGSGEKCGTGEARISGTLIRYCEYTSTVNFEAFAPICGQTIERRNAVTCEAGNSCPVSYLFKDLDTTDETQFTGQWICGDGTPEQLIFTPPNVLIRTDSTTEVTVGF